MVLFWSSLPVNVLETCSFILSSVFFNKKFAITASAAANLFTDFFKSNFVCVDDAPHFDFSFDINSMLDFGPMSISVDDISYSIFKLKSSAKVDPFVKCCHALIVPL